MKNITNTRPDLPLRGRLHYTVQLVDDRDLHNKDVLDIGCGFGWFELHALRKEAARVAGIEVTEQDLKTAKTHITDERAQFQTGSAIDIPFPADSFDTVVSWEVVEHIPKRSENRMLQEVNRVLKQNGVFYLSTPYRGLFSTLLDPAWWLAGHRHYSVDSMVRFANRNGFTVEQVTTKGSWWEIAMLWNLYIAKWVFRRPPFFESYFMRKVDQEYRKETGQFSIFIKMRKTLRGD